MPEGGFKLGEAVVEVRATNISQTNAELEKTTKNADKAAVSFGGLRRAMSALRAPALGVVFAQIVTRLFDDLVNRNRKFQESLKATEKQSRDAAANEAFKSTLNELQLSLVALRQEIEGFSKAVQEAFSSRTEERATSLLEIVGAFIASFKEIGEINQKNFPSIKQLLDDANAAEEKIHRDRVRRAQERVNQLERERKIRLQILELDRREAQSGGFSALGLGGNTDTLAAQLQALSFQIQGATKDANVMQSGFVN